MTYIHLKLDTPNMNQHQYLIFSNDNIEKWINVIFRSTTIVYDFISFTFLRPRITAKGLRTVYSNEFIDLLLFCFISVTFFKAHNNDQGQRTVHSYEVLIERILNILFLINICFIASILFFVYVID